MKDQGSVRSDLGPLVSELFSSYKLLIYLVTYLLDSGRVGLKTRLYVRSSYVIFGDYGRGVKVCPLRPFPTCGSFRQVPTSDKT